MPQTAIFGPVIALVVLTLAVLVYTGFKRFQAGFAGRVKGSDFRYGETANVPPDVAESPESALLFPPQAARPTARGTRRRPPTLPTPQPLLVPTRVTIPTR